jgi:hypothetical protein
MKYDIIIRLLIFMVSMGIKISAICVFGPPVISVLLFEIILKGMATSKSQCGWTGSYVILLSHPICIGYIIP